MIQASDERLKKEIQPVDGSLGKLSKFRGVSYKWKDLGHEKKCMSLAGEKSEIHGPSETAGRKFFGPIAQEVETVFPEMVYTDENGIKAIACFQMIGPMVRPIN